MRVRRAVITTWTVGLLVAQSTAGCGIELVRPTLDPPAVTARPVLAPLEAGLTCRVTNDEDFYAAQAAYALATIMRGAGLFRGDVVTSFDPEGPDARCEARLTITSNSEPEIRTASDDALIALVALSGGTLFPLFMIWTDQEPDLVATYALEVMVRGEEETGVRYQVVARGTISAQSPDAEAVDRNLPPARAQLRDLALESLVSRFTDDRTFHEQLRAQLSDAPATELEPLLVTKETYSPRARWRTRKLVGWKSESLETHVSQLKTNELRALVGRLEACMLDLTHEASAAKDEAGRKVAAGADDRNERDLSLAYIERVEALRPVLAAVKEELVGRAR